MKISTWRMAWIMLAACVCVALLPQRSATQQSAVAASEFEVRVTAANPSSRPATQSPDVTAVRASLEPTIQNISQPLGGSPPSQIDPFSAIATALAASYGPAAVSPSPKALGYTWRYNDRTKQWELVCTFRVLYQVLLSTVVNVEVSVSTVL